MKTTFAALRVGDAFRLRTRLGPVGGVLVKTGAQTYGYILGNPLWVFQSPESEVELVSRGGAETRSAEKHEVAA